MRIRPTEAVTMTFSRHKGIISWRNLDIYIACMLYNSGAYYDNMISINLGVTIRHPYERGEER